MNHSMLLGSFLLVINHVNAFSQHASNHRRLVRPLSLSTSFTPSQHTHHPSSKLLQQPSFQHNAFKRTNSPSPLHARPKSKWDDLIDEDEEEDNEIQSIIQGGSGAADMVYTEENIRRQADAYDQLESIGGKDLINDVYVRAPGGKEWWLVGKIARISDISPEQAIYRQWTLVERHVWALRLPVRPISDLATPFEVWYAPGHSEYDAARNDPSVPFVKVSNIIQYNEGVEVPASFVGFVGKFYDEGSGDPLFFVERNVVDGSCLRGREMEGDWVLKSELDGAGS